jgi:hypothetical protein
MGGTFGVSVMGATLAAGLASGLVAAGVDPSTVSLNGLIDPLKKSSASALDSTLQQALGGAMHWVFLIALLASIGALIVTTLAPRGTVQSAQAIQPAPTSAE